MLPTLDENSHTYKLKGREVPGVTKVLSAVLGSTWKIPKEILENAGEIGQLVHDATALDVSGDLDDDTVDPEIMGYVRAFRRFREEVKPEFLSTEEVVYHSSYNYAGKLDHIVKIAGHIGVLDKKTGVVLKTNELQVAAYREAKISGLTNVNGPRITKDWVLYLKDDGTYRLHLVQEHARAFQLFISALNCYRFMEEK